MPRVDKEDLQGNILCGYGNEFRQTLYAFVRIEEAEAVFAHLVFQRESIPFEAAFLAGKAFREYRRPGGQRSSPLPDFFIGAHAAVAGYRLLTRDPARFRTYFPKLDLISPDRPLPG